MGLRDRPGLLLATGALVARNRQKKKQEQQRQQYQAQSAQQQHVIQAQNQALGTVEHKVTLIPKKIVGTLEVFV